MKTQAGLVATQPMLEVLSKWSLFEALAIVVVVALVVSGVIGLMQGRKR